MDLKSWARTVRFGLRHPGAVRGYPPDDSAASIEAALLVRFRDVIVEHPITVAGFEAWVRRAAYPASYAGYAGERLLNEKLLEHYVSFELVRPREGSRLLDMGSAQSPFVEAMRARFGVEAFAVDPSYERGIRGHHVGAFGHEVPMPDGSVDAIVLHCALDHFEGDSDARFVREAGRLLAKGGRVCSVPLYVSDRLSNLTDPACAGQGLAFDAGARIHRVDGHRNRFGRYYSPDALEARLLRPARESGLETRLVRVTGERAAIPNNYARWALVLEKVAAD